MTLGRIVLLVVWSGCLAACDSEPPPGAWQPREVRGDLQVLPPPCRSAPADADEAPCNPYAADSPYSNAHRNNYAQKSTPLAGPDGNSAMSILSRPVDRIPMGAIFSPPYPDGRRVAWMPAVSLTQNSLVYKVDYQTGELIDAYSRSDDEAALPRFEPAISRVYGFLDRYNRLYRTSGRRIEVVGDSQPGVLESPIALLATWQLPARALCGADDYAVGLNLLYDGRAVFVTHRGMVGVLPPSFTATKLEEDPGQGLIVTAINGDACRAAEPDDSQLEKVTNNFVSDEHGAIFILTDHAQHRFDVLEDRIEHRWGAAYRRGTEGGGGVRLDAGSGSTPTLMGMSSQQDRFVVITDGAPLMNLVLFWRDEIPEDWQPIAPGKDRRIACEFPVTFGDPARTASQSEQSVVVRGYGAYVPNNELGNSGLLALLPKAGSVRMAVAGLITRRPHYAPYGFERIDWNPQTRRCETRWVNREVSIPNGVPYLSVGSRMVYGIGQRDGVWGLEGMDMDSGSSRLWVPAGKEMRANAFYSAISIGTEGDIWTGGVDGYLVYRPRAR